MKSENTRSSNFELLRIFAMFGIVLHHLMVNDLDVLGYNTAAYSSDLGGGNLSNTKFDSSLWRGFVPADNRMVWS